jgi:hypothetical protein
LPKRIKVAEAMNGDATSDGLNAMLGDTGDLQTLLIQNIKSGNQLKGSTEEWTQAKHRKNLSEYLQISVKIITPVFESIEIQFINWVKTLPSTFDVSYMEDAKFVQKAVEYIKKKKKFLAF